MPIQNLYEDDWDNYTHDDVEEALKEKFQEHDAAIQEAAASGAAVPDDEMSDISENVVQNKIIKAYVDGVETRLRAILDTIVDADNVSEAIDTFNEVVNFLAGINNSETLAAKLALKANSADVQTLVETKQDVLTGNDTLMTINGDDVHYGEEVTIEVEDGVGFESVSTPSTADGTVIITLTNGNSIVLDLNHTHPDKQDVVTKVTRSGIANESLALESGKFYVFSTPLSSLTVTAFTAPSNGIGVYAGRFTAASALTSLTWPTGTILTDTIPSSIDADHVYEFNVVDGVLIMKDVTTPSS